MAAVGQIRGLFLPVNPAMFSCFSFENRDSLYDDENRDIGTAPSSLTLRVTI